MIPKFVIRQTSQIVKPTGIIFLVKQKSEFNWLEFTFLNKTSGNQSNNVTYRFKTKITPP